MRPRSSHPFSPSPADAPSDPSPEKAVEPLIAHGSSGRWITIIALVCVIYSLSFAGVATGADAMGGDATGEDGPRAYAVFVEEAPLIDGDLSDPVWEKAQVIDAFTQVEPKTGAEPSYRTENPRAHRR